MTSPDPEFNRDSKDYFTRHMRILETCTTAWPQPEMQTQIDALRDAFSADTSKPFQLKPYFPFGSPPVTGMSLQPSPPLETSQFHQPSMSRHQSFSTQVPQISYPAQPITPPVSAGLPVERERQMSNASAGMMSNNLHSMSMAQVPLTNSSTDWNPTPIFQYVIPGSRSSR